MTVKGYKAMAPDMTCRGFQYEVGKTYELDGPLKMCVRGFHFCERMPDVFGYYDVRDCIVFEVEALGMVVTDGDKSVTDRIRIVRRLDPIVEGRLRYGYGYGNGYGNGDGRGHGYGDGRGNGHGDSRGHGYGYGNGNGHGNGDSRGHGYGYGNGYCYGYCYGYGYGDNINKVLTWEE